MEDSDKMNSYNNEEITLKELILTIQEYWKELWRNWWLIALIALPVTGYFVYKTYSTAAVYSAEIRFIVEGEGGSGMGGLGGLLGSFGIRKPGGTNPYKILEVARSKRILSEVLFTTVNGDTLLANKIIDTYKLDERWAKRNPAMLGLRLKKQDPDSMNILERKALLSCFSKLLGPEKDRSKALFNISLDEEKGIFSIVASTEDEKMSLTIANKAFDEIKYFFEDKTLEDKKFSRDLLKFKADSLVGLINYKSVELARFEDKNRGLMLNESNLKKGKLLLEIDGLRTAYTEALKSYEFADYSYRDSKPYFLSIDRPLEPLTPVKEKLFRNLILGIFLGCFAGAVFVLGRKIYRTTMESTHKNSD